MRWKNFTPTAITAVFLIVLLMIGNAQAYIVNINPDKSVVDLGEKVTFIVSVDQQGNDKNITSITFTLNGTETISCDFREDGRAISSNCKGIRIRKLNEIDHGYAYGYGIKKTISYKIILETDKYRAGDYQATIIVHTSREDTIKTVPIKIVEPFSCSFRAKDGSAIYNNTDYGKAKLNFYITDDGAQSGQGSLIIQDRQKRASFTFEEDGIDIIGNNSTYLKLGVSGELKVNRDKTVSKDAIIVIDKNKRKATLTTTDGKLIAENMDIYFVKGCGIEKKA